MMNPHGDVPIPEHQSIFQDTYHGVPNPNIPHTHPYPTRYHGPVYGVPRFFLPYQDQAWNEPMLHPQTPGCLGCKPMSGLGAATVSVNVSNMLLDAALGGVIGYLIAGPTQRKRYAAYGAGAAVLLGVLVRPG